MKLWFNKRQLNTNKERSKAVSGERQRVYSYYTASKRQIDQFDRNNQLYSQQQNNKTNSVLNASIKGKFLIIVLSLILLLFSLGLSLDASVVINGPKYQDIKTYNNLINDIINKDKRNLVKLSLQTNTIRQEIIKALPEAHSVNVYAPLIGIKPVVIIGTNEPFAVLVQPNASSLIIDSSGRAIADINNSTIDTSKLSVIDNQSGLIFAINNQIFSPNEMIAFKNLHYQILQDGDSKQITYIMPETPREIRLQRAGYFVKFGLDDSSGAGTDLQYGSLKSIEKSIQEQGTMPPSEYIDVRLGDKAYIK